MIDIFIYIELLLFVSYLLFIGFRYGILPSISESYYRLGKLQVLFLFFTWSIAFPIILIGGFIDHTHSWTFFMSGSAMTFVGAASAFREDLTKGVHFSGAVSSIVFGFLGLWLVLDFWKIPIVAVLLMPVIFKYVKNSTWWVEVLAFATIMLGLLLRAM